MIPALGVRVFIYDDRVELVPSQLALALGTASPVTIPRLSITGASLTAPTAIVGGSVTISIRGSEKGKHSSSPTVRFAPGTVHAAQQLVNDLSAAPPDQGALALDFGAHETATDAPATPSVASRPAAQRTDTDGGCADPAGRTPVVTGVAISPDAQWSTVGHWALVSLHADGSAGPTTTGEGLNATFIDALVAAAATAPLVSVNAAADMTVIGRAAAEHALSLPRMQIRCALTLARVASGSPMFNGATAADLRTHLGLASQPPSPMGVATTAAQAAIAVMRGHDATDLNTLERALSLSPGVLDDSGMVPPLRWVTTRPEGDPRDCVTSFDEGAATNSPSEPSPVGSPGKTAPRGAQSSRRSSPSSARGAWNRVSTPSKVPQPDPHADPNGPLYGEHVTLTGDFSPFDKGDVWKALAEAGAIVGKSTTKKTTVLAIGTWGSVTSKEKRADELIAAGQSIRKLTAEELYPLIGLDPAATQPPF